MKKPETLIALLWGSRALALDAGDIHQFVEKKYGPGKIVSVVVDGGRLARVEFSKSVSDSERRVIENAAARLDIASSGRSEINEEIRRELLRLEGGVEDEERYMELKTKLLRALETSDLDLKKARLESARRQR